LGVKIMSKIIKYAIYIIMLVINVTVV